MANIISCRTAMFNSVEEAFSRFPETGIRAAEVPPPADGNYRALGDRAGRAGITIATLATHVDLTSDETTKPFWSVIDGAASIRVPKIFVSAQAPDDVPREQVIRRLHNTAAYAAEHGVTVCMETHPPLGTNGDVARATLIAVNHPGLRFNFDTANIYYYNQGTDSVTELRKVAGFVAAVHLKDTDGGYHSPNFPALGTGVVDFPSVFQTLANSGFTGPYTLEVEGAAVDGFDVAQRVTFLQKCVAYLRKIGVMP